MYDACLNLTNQKTMYRCRNWIGPAQWTLVLVECLERLLSRLFPPKLGKIEGFETCVTLYLIESGGLKIIEPVDSWAGKVLLQSVSGEGRSRRVLDGAGPRGSTRLWSLCVEIPKH